MVLFSHYGVSWFPVVVISVCLKVHCIMFEINNMDVNRVVYVTEENIKMTCSEPNITNAQFEILHESNAVRETSNHLKLTFSANFVELTILSVKLTNGGAYTCNVRNVGSIFVEATASLMLNVESGGAQCLYDDSSLDWIEGDVKNLSCYHPSLITDELQWQLLNSPSSTFNLTTSSLYRGSKKSILFAVVGPLKSSDNGNMYRCFHTLHYLADNSGWCVFGPINVSPKVTSTTVIAATTSPTAVANLLGTDSASPSDGLGINVHSTPQVMEIPTDEDKSFPKTPHELLTSSSTRSSSANVTTTINDPSPITMIGLVIISVTCVVIVVACTTCLIVLFKFRNKNDQKQNDSRIMKHQVYDPFDGCMKPTDNSPSTQEKSHPMAESNVDVNIGTLTDENNPVSDEYDKIDHNMGKQSYRRTPPVAAARRSLLQDNIKNDNEYDKADRNKEKLYDHLKPPVPAERYSFGRINQSVDMKDIEYDKVRNVTGKTNGQDQPFNDKHFKEANDDYDKLNTSGFGRQKGKHETKSKSREKVHENINIQELYAKVDKSRSLERSKAKREQSDNKVVQ